MRLPFHKLSLRSWIILAVILLFGLWTLPSGTTRQDAREAQAAAQFSNRAIVSLASTSARFENELPITLWSLLHQTVRPAEIRLHLPFVANGEEQHQLRTSNLPLEVQSAIQEGYINIVHVQDIGPATKFRYILQDRIGEGDLDRPIIVLDDDHAYAPTLVHELLQGHETMPNSSLGFRGWRVRRDLHWGVNGDAEFHRHVVTGDRLKEPYRVSVLTANEGYLVTPRLVRDNPYFSVSSTADDKDPSHLVDDIVMAGILAEQRAPRHIIPTQEASLDITVVHPLEQHMKSEGSTRGQANTATLHKFKAAWEAEDLFYVFQKDATAAKGVSTVLDDPVEASTVTRLRRVAAVLRRKIVLKAKFPKVSFA